jgi:ATP-dependent NAD(P)H-hydrate dehydratase
MIRVAQQKQLPLVIDGDGLWIVKNSPSLISGYRAAILTPNVVEYGRLCNAILGLASAQIEAADEKQTLKSLAAKLGGVTIVKKGAVDLISDGTLLIECAVPGGKKRCGGQGDVLAGTMGTFVAWFLKNSDSLKVTLPPTKEFPEEIPRGMLAAYAACTLTRTCSRLAYETYGRATTTTSLIENLSNAFRELFEEPPLPSPPKETTHSLL